MEISFGSRLKEGIQHGWNVFKNSRDPTMDYYKSYGVSYSYRPDRPRFTGNNRKSIVTPIFNRIALDVASIKIQHCKIDKDERFEKVIESSLNNCLTLEANIDQTGRAFILDAVISMFDEGVVGLVPIDTDRNPEDGSFEVETMRTGKIIKWHPSHVEVRVYNERIGEKDNFIVHKRSLGIVENPFFEVINEPNSTLQRLVRKLNLLDVVDEQSSSGKLDLIIQLPYTIKTEARRQQAENRRSEIERQLKDSKYGIAYADSVERITQLNRPVENNLLKQVEYLTSMLYSQLGITQSILDGTADEKTMLNYYNRTIEPIVSALVDEMKRKFLSKTARTQGQTIMYFRDLFSLITVKELAEIADPLLRNEVATSNEMRHIMRWKPSKDPKADKLQNSNMPQKPNTQTQSTEVVNETNEGEEKIQNGNKL